MAGLVFILYFLGLLFFLLDKRSPFQEWAEANPWISIPLFLFLGAIGAGVLIS